MNAMTQPIRVILNTREPGYRAKTYLAYAGVFATGAGDAVRYTLGWLGWGILLGVLLCFTAVLFFKDEPKRVIKQMPWPLGALLGLMALSTTYSFYPGFTALAVFAQLATTLFGLFLAGSFSWRHLLKIFANVVRFILVSSFVFEFIAAAIA